MLVLIAAVVIAAGVGASQPKAVKTVGKETACLVTFRKLKMCKAPAPAVTAPAQTTGEAK